MKKGNVLLIVLIITVFSSVVAYQLTLSKIKSRDDLEDEDLEIVEDSTDIEHNVSSEVINNNNLVEENEIVETDSSLAQPIQGNYFNSNSDDYYIVMAYNGKITVFDYFLDDFESYFLSAVSNNECEEADKEIYKYYYLNDYGESYVKEVIDLPISLLSDDEQLKLVEGIVVYGDDELIRLLENYTS